MAGQAIRLTRENSRRRSDRASLAETPTPLRIGLLATEFPPELGGMSELAIRLAEQLARRDAVTVLSAILSANGSEPPGPSAFAVRPCLTGWPHRDEAALADTGVDVWLALNAGLAPLAPRLSAPFFTYFHGNDFLAPWLPCGVRFLERIRRPYLSRLRHVIRRRAIRRCLPSLAGLLTNSHATAALLARSLGTPADRIAVCPPGVHDDFFQPRARRTAGASDALHLLTVSRLTRHSARKNVDGVLRAIAQLGPSFDLRYTVVGDGDDRARLEALAASLGVAPRVHFLGSVSFERLRSCYAAADVFVLASKASAVDVEGFGIVYLEAAAAGTPSICSRQGGAVEAVEDGRSGIVIDSSAPAAIAAGIARFARERERGRFAPEQVRAFAEAHRWSAAAARIRDVVAAAPRAAASC